MFNTSETSGNALPEVFNLTDRWVCDPGAGTEPSADEAGAKRRPMTGSANPGSASRSFPEVFLEAIGDFLTAAYAVT